MSTASEHAEVLSFASRTAGGGARPMIARCRTAQRAWAATGIDGRLAVLRRARHALADRAVEIAAQVERRPIEATLASEVLPLLAALELLERRAARILAPRRERARGAPLWLGGTDVAVEREPYGVVLVIGPANYPLMLPGIQAVQALAAGNGVIVKPGRDGTAALCGLARILASAGLPRYLFAVADEAPAAAERLCRAGVDRIFLTGSEDAGRAIAPLAAEAYTPITLELSGHDAAFVRHDADLERAAAALAFGMTFNGGATCMAPRRVFVARAVATELEARLEASVAGLPPAALDARTARTAMELIDEALANGARLVCSGLEVGAGAQGHRLRPTVLASVTPAMRVSRTELFAPLITLTPVGDDDEALSFAAASPYALGATVFSRDLRAARRLARRIDAGVIVINDAIVPSADPRVPCAARRRSGHGATRGEEGLLELTRPKAIVVARGPRRHLARFRPSARFLASYIRLAYGQGGRARLRAARRMLVDWTARHRAEETSA